MEHNQITIIKDDSGRSISRTPEAKNDCAIRVLCKAFNEDYDKIYNLYKEVGPMGGGYSDDEMLLVVKKLRSKYKIQKYSPSINLRLRKFITEYPKGNYILSYRNHVTNVINGIVYDIDKNENYFKIENIEVVYKISKMNYQ